MSPSDNLIKAALNRLGARIEERLVNAAAELKAIARETPEKLQKEWNLFQEEVIEEAERLDKEDEEKGIDVEPQEEGSKSFQTQEKIDLLRAKVAEIGSKLEAMH